MDAPPSVLGTSMSKMEHHVGVALVIAMEGRVPHETISAKPSMDHVRWGDA